MKNVIKRLPFAIEDDLIEEFLEQISKEACRVGNIPDNYYPTAIAGATGGDGQIGDIIENIEINYYSIPDVNTPIEFIHTEDDLKMYLSEVVGNYKNGVESPIRPIEKVFILKSDNTESVHHTFKLHIEILPNQLIDAIPFMQTEDSSSDDVMVENSIYFTIDRTSAILDEETYISPKVKVNLRLSDAKRNNLPNVHQLACYLDDVYRDKRSYYDTPSNQYTPSIEDRSGYFRLDKALVDRLNPVDAHDLLMYIKGVEGCLINSQSTKYSHSIHYTTSMVLDKQNNMIILQNGLGRKTKQRFRLGHGEEALSPRLFDCYLSAIASDIYFVGDTLYGSCVSAAILESKSIEEVIKSVKQTMVTNLNYQFKGLGLIPNDGFNYISYHNKTGEICFRYRGWGDYYEVISTPRLAVYITDFIKAANRHDIDEMKYQLIQLSSFYQLYYQRIVSLLKDVKIKTRFTSELECTLARKKEYKEFINKIATLSTIYPSLRIWQTNKMGTKKLSLYGVSNLFHFDIVIDNGRYRLDLVLDDHCFIFEDSLLKTAPLSEEQSGLTCINIRKDIHPDYVFDEIYHFLSSINREISLTDKEYREGVEFLSIEGKYVENRDLYLIMFERTNAPYQGTAFHRLTFDTVRLVNGDEPYLYYHITSDWRTRSCR